MPKLTIIISEDRAGHSIQQRIERELASLPARLELELKIVPHLYNLAPDGPGMKYLQSVPGDMVVLAWMYPRAAFWTLDANGVRGRMGRTALFPEEELPPAADKREGIDVPERTIWCIDAREQDDPGPLRAEIDRIAAEVTGAPAWGTAAQEQAPTVAEANGRVRIDEPARPRWYPVVDYGRCGNCLECLNFCLFGVFGINDEGHVLVEQPDACRDGCPACARVCPSGAIMFPRHNQPVIAGDPRAPREAFHVSLVQLFQGNDELLGQALAERDRAMREKSRADQSPAAPPASEAPPEKDKLDRLVDDLDRSGL